MYDNKILIDCDPPRTVCFVYPRPPIGDYSIDFNGIRIFFVHFIRLLNVNYCNNSGSNIVYNLKTSKVLDS